MEPEKGKRAANFTDAEKVFLTELVEKNINIINAKFNSSITNQRKKQVWEDIAKQLNARGGAQRTATQIKEKWMKSCGAAREEAAKEKVHARTTGGGPPAKANDPVTQKILELHQGAPNFFWDRWRQSLGYTVHNRGRTTDTYHDVTGRENKNDASELVVLNDPSNYVACNTEQRQIIGTVDSPTLRVKGVLGQESPSCQASVGSVVAPITTKAKSSITKPISVTQAKKKQTYQ
ncbi:unnamed protein product [Mytilus coruscus]|uniref:Myb/SANT-like DNA-binding domain-containing protein n=1 Tax=Mytilus coruscus TaxID=42192 RepID=A0A6J8A5X9_MYTCO|nr:unnamed protein product [Mytilus coruscus]